MLYISIFQCYIFITTFLFLLAIRLYYVSQSLKCKYFSLYATIYLTYRISHLKCIYHLSVLFSIIFYITDSFFLHLLYSYFSIPIINMLCIPLNYWFKSIYKFIIYLMFLYLLWSYDYNWYLRALNPKYRLATNFKINLKKN